MSLFIGLLSGTSMDGIDAGLVDFGVPNPMLVASRVYPIPAELRERLMMACGHVQRDQDYVDEIGSLDGLLGHLFADAVMALLEQTGNRPDDVRAIGSHGQTIRHRPRNQPPFTLQIGDPNIIAERTGITTVADFRRRDMAAGGEGAPLVPAFHQFVFQQLGESRVVANIGGMANITILSAKSSEPITGFDTGPGNVLLDVWAALHLGAPMDTDGRWAGEGKTHEGLLRRLRNDDYFSAPPPKTAGRERFNLDWLHRCIADIRPTPVPADIQRTLCELTVTTLRDAIMTHAPACREVLVCGGGARNPMLLQGLKERLPHCLVDTTHRYGIHPDWVETMAFAWLAERRLLGLPGNVPSVTGARHPVVLGAVYPGR
uniref:Anhydro-N-acetylmuramic acid kinase n=1 Tax=Candidatus Kentrum sp. MB TaxID=2138164 RepID=A0A450WZ06_9GAMM|nr:MAG: anhydro-N-acetylmuramic acid kinase [Candidatus Kentron sp. MB]VFK32659.1 MAG: anhydro-N-acetylmuramic acid kinase [Candidatus Kentron sp. MB]VFK76018.1 MAG: anhydro-N-acetylmuramic acid kinase [Candidatus Kentron sp. MB]